MESVVVTGVLTLLLFFVMAFFIWIVGMAFSNLNIPKDESKKASGSLGTAFVAGLLLGIWMND